MKIGYVNGHWHSNIGNAFYGIGAINLLRSISNNNKVFNLPDAPQVYWHDLVNNYDPLVNLDLDLILLSGPCLNIDLLQYYKNTFDNLKKKGKFIGFLSAGASNYSAEESSKVINFLKNYNIKFFFTRDRLTFALYNQKLNCPVYDGICTSMFLNKDDYANIKMRNYYIFNFNKSLEPKIFFKGNKYKFKKRIPFISRRQNSLKKKFIIRTSSEGFTKDKKDIFFEKDCYWSSTPDGYLSIYKSALTVFSDRVHSCCAALILGRKAMYFKNNKRSSDNRSSIFHRIKLEKIFTEPVMLNMKFINQEKKKMKKFLTKFLK